MSRRTVDDLQAIADAIVAEAVPGEQIAASLSRSTETDVRVRNGEVEHFVSAQSQGVGITVIVDGRTGTSSAAPMNLQDLLNPTVFLLLSRSCGTTTLQRFPQRKRLT
jgi:predicted Zn-dependent protease